MNPNDMQVGGNHYRSEYQHWDLAINVGMGYFEAAATKYVTRWRKKDGVQGLQKAAHYLNKLVSVLPTMAPRRGVQLYGLPWVHSEVQTFNAMNKVPLQDALIIHRIACWDTREDLISARDAINHLIDIAISPPKLSEENHYARDTEGE